MVTELWKLEQLKDVRRLVYLTAKVAVLEVQEEYFSLRSMAESFTRFGLKNYKIYLDFSYQYISIIYQSSLSFINYIFVLSDILI